jgi:hypothetical protein
VAHVEGDQFDLVGQPPWTAAGVHLRVEVVEGHDAPSFVDEPAGEGAADETGSAGEQHGALSLCGKCQESNHPW